MDIQTYNHETLSSMNKKENLKSARTELSK